MGGLRFATLLPRTVASAEAMARADQASLFADERAHIADASARRQAEFTTVRRCAGEALERIGRQRPSLVPGRGGAPLWPMGVLGSMTHCLGRCAAAVTSDSSIAGLGIDLEEGSQSSSDLLDVAVLPSERAAVQKLHRSGPAGLWERVIFSAKESVYKAWYPLEGRWLDFEEVRISLHQDSHLAGTFAVTLLADPQGSSRWEELAEGRWMADERFVATALVLRSAVADAHPPFNSVGTAPRPKDE